MKTSSVNLVSHRDKAITFFLQKDKKNAFLSLSKSVELGETIDWEKKYEVILAYDQDYNKIVGHTNLLGLAIINGSKKSLNLLLNLKPDIDCSVTKSDNDDFDSLSPLMLAARIGYTDMVQLLLDAGSDLTFSTAKNVNILSMSYLKIEIYFMILLHAKNHDILETLLHVNDQSLAVFNGIVELGKPEFLKLLCHIKDHSLLSNLLHSIRRHCLVNPDKDNSLLEEFCLLIRDRYNTDKIFSPPRYQGNQAPNLTQGKNKKEDFGFMPQSKEGAIRKAISQLKYLFLNPSQCIKYLQFLNIELVNYYKTKYQKDFPCLNPHSYEFKVIRDLYYPIPSTDYIGLPQHHILQEFAEILLSKYDLAKHFYKFHAFVESSLANKIVAEGNIFLEDQLGTTLFHNKFSHLLQIIILIYAIEDNKIDSVYEENGVLHKITPKDILSGLVTLTSSGKNSLWLNTLDKRRYTILSFGDPYRLSSLIMNQGAELGFRELSDLITDNFCKGLVKLLSNDLLHNDNKTYEEFYNEVKDLDVRILFQWPKLLAKSIEHDLQKGRTILHGGIDEGFTVVEKKYSPCRMFKARKFTDFIPEEIASIPDEDFQDLKKFYN